MPTRFMLLACVLAASCGGGEPQVTMIGSAGGTVVSADGKVTLVFPAGALTQDTPISIAPLSGGGDEGFVGGTFYEFGPDGTQFAQPVTITIQSDQPVPAGARIAKEILGGVGKLADASQASGQSVTAQIHSFSRWGITSCDHLWCMAASVEPGSVTVAVTAAADVEIERAVKMCQNGQSLNQCLDGADGTTYQPLFFAHGPGPCTCPPGHTCLCTFHAVTTTFSDTSIDPVNSAIYFYRVQGDPTPGVYAFSIGSGTTCSGFSLAASLPGGSLQVNRTYQATVTATRSSYDGDITLSFTANPNVRISNAPGIIPVGQNTATFSVTPLATGSNPVVVNGSGGGATCRGNLPVTVSGGCNVFTLSFNPTQATNLAPAWHQDVAVNINRIDTTSPITLTVSVPAGDPLFGYIDGAITGANPATDTTTVRVNQHVDTPTPVSGSLFVHGDDGHGGTCDATLPVTTNI